MTTIWLVDDDDVVIETITMILKAYHYETARFSSGQDFLDALATHHHPDLVILDIVIHPPPDGNEVMRQLSQGDHPPVLAITGSPDMIASDILPCFVGIIPKPCTMQELKASIENALAGTRSPLPAK